MKKLYLFLVTIVVTNLSFSQTGKVGIGTINPQADLHIKSNDDFIFTLLDGVGENDEESKNYVLESNDNKGTVKKRMDPAFNEVKFAVLSGLGEQYSDFKLTNLSQIDAYNYETGWEAINGARIILPYGRWAVYITSLASIKEPSTMSNYHQSTAITLNIKMSVYAPANPTNQTTKDVEGNFLHEENGEGQASGTIIFPNPNGIIRGVIIINNNDIGRRDRAYAFSTKAQLNTRGNTDNLTSLKNINIVGLLHKTKVQNQIFAIPLQN